MDHKDAKTDRPAIEEILRYCQRATKEGLMGAIGPQTTVDICEYALSLETENASLRKEWQGFTESIAPLIECEPHDIQGAGYILNAVAAMQEEERNYSGIGDEIREAENENAALLTELDQLRFVADKYLYLTEVLKDMPEILSQILDKTNNDEFKAKFAEAGEK